MSSPPKAAAWHVIVWMLCDCSILLHRAHFSEGFPGNWRNELVALASLSGRHESLGGFHLSNIDEFKIAVTWIITPISNHLCLFYLYEWSLFCYIFHFEFLEVLDGFVCEVSTYSDDAYRRPSIGFFFQTDEKHHFIRRRGDETVCVSLSRAALSSFTQTFNIFAPMVKQWIMSWSLFLWLPVLFPSELGTHIFLVMQEMPHII